MATFDATEFPLQVSRDGEGSITLGTQPLDVGTAWLARDTTITMSATPAAGWAFSRWEAPCSAQPSPERCELRVVAAASARAVFVRLYDVTVVVEGPGSVSAVLPIGLCTAQCSGKMPAGSKLAMTATAAMRSTFVGWTNACASQADCDLTITAEVTITARFQPDIALTASGDGAGTVMGAQGCSTPPCSLPFGPGRSYQLQPVPAENSRFVRYEGCPDVRGPICVVNRYAPSINLVFEQIVVDPMLGDATSVLRGKIVSSPEAEFVWMQGSGVMSLGTAREDAGVSPNLDRWVLFQTRPGPAREVLTTGTQAELLEARAQLDGGMVFVVRALEATSIGSTPLSPFTEAIVSMSSSGAIEWTQLNIGENSDVVGLRTDRTTGQTYVAGALRPQAGTVTYGSTTIQPPTTSSTSAYVASIDRHGQREWAVDRSVSTWSDMTRLHVLDSGPAVFDTTSEATGGLCVPTWSPTPSERYASVWVLYTKQGACLRAGLTPQPMASGSPANVIIDAVTDGPGPGISMVGRSTAPAMWAQASVPRGLFFAYQEGSAPPVVDGFSSCTDTVVSHVEPYGPTTVVLAGNGPCIPDLETGTGTNAIVAVYDRQAGSVVRGWKVPNATLLSVARLNERELRVVLRFPAPARIGGVDYPRNGLVVWRLLVVTLRP